MNRFLIFLITSTLVLTGCQKKDATAEAGHDESEEGAIFKAGHGLSFSPVTKTAIGLETVEAETRDISHAVKLSAQIYRSAQEPSQNGALEKQGLAYATALIDPLLAKSLKVGTLIESAAGPGRVARIDNTLEGGMGKAELLIELPDPEAKLQVGTFLPIETGLDKQESVAIPSTAVLETATGLFAYVQNGESLLRTPIATGITDGQWVEVTDGLYEGDIVASKSVSSLYLIELRATKGGGHSH